MGLSAQDLGHVIPDTKVISTSCIVLLPDNNDPSASLLRLRILPMTHWHALIMTASRRAPIEDTTKGLYRQRTRYSNNVLVNHSARCWLSIFDSLHINSSFCYLCSYGRLYFALYHRPPSAPVCTPRAPSPYARTFFLSHTAVCSLLSGVFPLVKARSSLCGWSLPLRGSLRILVHRFRRLLVTRVG